MRLTLKECELLGLFRQRRHYLEIQRMAGEDFKCSLAGEMLEFIDNDIATILNDVDIRDAYSRLKS